MTNPQRFVGHHVLVTGGGTGLGLACATAIASEGAVVTICGRREPTLAEAAAAISRSTGGSCRYVVADIVDEESVRNAIEHASSSDGTLHAVVANAGGATAVGPLPLVDRSAFQLDIDLNVIGTFLTIKHAAPALARAGGGSIVAISSIAGCLTHRQMGAYSVAKAALEMLVRNAADELGPWRIRVNAVRPGLVPTDASQSLATNEATRRDYLDQMPLQRLGTGEDIAGAVLYLAGPDSTWVTGQCLSVDGGHSLRRGPDISPLLGGYFGAALDSLMGPPPVD